MGRHGLGTALGLEWGRNTAFGGRVLLSFERDTPFGGKRVLVDLIPECHDARRGYLFRSGSLIAGHSA